MRKKLAVLAACVLAVGALGVVAPAQASEAPPWPLNCAQGGPTVPGLGTVYVDGQGLHVNIDAVQGDADAVSQYAVDVTLHWAECILSRVPTGPAFCLAGVAANADAYYDISGSQVHVYYPALLAAVRACGFET